MNFIYVLVSNEEDTYYEQFLISAQSLITHNPSCNVFLLMDQDTKKTLINKRTFHNTLGIKEIIVSLPSNLSTRDKSRYLKTTMNKYINDTFVYIDGDTVVCGEINKFPDDAEIAMVLDGHTQFSDSYSYESNMKLCNKLKYQPGFNNCYFNGGFMYVKNTETTKTFFNLWHKYWNEGRLNYSIGLDQPSLNHSNAIMGGIIKELDGTYNCQVARRNPSLKFVHNAKVLHYFATRKKNCFDLSDSEIQKTILYEKHKTLDKILENPKSAFSDVVDLNTDIKSLKFEKTNLYQLGFYIYNRWTCLFAFTNLISKILLFIPRRTSKYFKDKK